MKYRFNEFNNITGFIRELLGEFNLPNIEVITDDSYVYEGKYYIKNLGVYRCLKTGYPDESEFEYIMNYYYNKPILDLTSTLSINEHSYNTQVHEYLGKYLRFLRDYKRLNLMPLYNCFSNRTINISYRIKDKNINCPFRIIRDDPQYTYYAIPVRLNQVYTIGIDTSRPIEIACLLFDGVEINKLYVDEAGKNNIVDKLISFTYQKINNCNLNKPIIYTKLKELATDDLVKNYLSNYHNIKLILKVPSYNNSSIAILEGDYINTSSSTPDHLIPIGYFGDKGPYKTIEGITSTCKYDYLKNYPTKLSLLSINDHLHHPFADRLVEYLFDEAITKLDELDENIMRTQLNIARVTPLSERKIKIYGIWGDEINKSIYNIQNESYMTYKHENKYITNKPFTLKQIPFNGSVDSEGNFKYREIKDKYNDLLTYVDKDIESYFLATGGE